MNKTLPIFLLFASILTGAEELTVTNLTTRLAFRDAQIAFLNVQYRQLYLMHNGGSGKDEKELADLAPKVQQTFQNAFNEAVKSGCPANTTMNSQVLSTTYVFQCDPTPKAPVTPTPTPKK